MAQRFQVLRCSFCHVFQVQQIKKSKKWNCKMCGEKQSVLKVFGQGSGFDCRCHVQKLNLLKGEVEQASMNMQRQTEEPGKRVDENTVVGLEENLGWQGQKMVLTSRWTKYLDKVCDEHEKKEEEEMVLIEKQIDHSWKNTAKNPRKCEITRLYPTDVQGPEQKRAARLAKDIRSFETREDAATEDTKSFRDTTCQTLIAPAANKLLFEPRSRSAPLSKWEKFLLSDECVNSHGLIAPEQERLETPVERLTPPGDKVADFMGIISSNSIPEPKQDAAILLDQVSNTEYAEISKSPSGRSGETPVLVSSLNMCSRQPEGPTSVPSISPPALKNLFKSLFSTGDDFDDHL